MFKYKTRKHLISEITNAKYDIKEFKVEIQQMRNNILGLEKQLHLVLEYAQNVMSKTDSINDLIKSQTESLKDLVRRDIK